ncbi:basic salivary proline-rich protein 2-like [Marmota monax]|uniref:basic salivary proline-rich protein 2-like n=1 Tax=Marmota monax TaxID=9995 RepID=UPI001EAFC572|nr:basic salivary proline-rich protein 2-like [Marmota monax]
MPQRWGCAGRRVVLGCCQVERPQEDGRIGASPRNQKFCGTGTSKFWGPPASASQITPDRCRGPAPVPARPQPRASPGSSAARELDKAGGRAPGPTEGSGGGAQGNRSGRAEASRARRPPPRAEQCRRSRGSGAGRPNRPRPRRAERGKARRGALGRPPRGLRGGPRGRRGAEGTREREGTGPRAALTASDAAGRLHLHLCSSRCRRGRRLPPPASRLLGRGGGKRDAPPPPPPPPPGDAARPLPAPPPTPPPLCLLPPPVPPGPLPARVPRQVRAEDERPASRAPRAFGRSSAFYERPQNLQVTPVSSIAT